MSSGLKQRLRRRLLGNRESQRIDAAASTVGLLGNRHYLEHCPHLRAPGFLPSINAYEFSFYSQNGEDGIILHLLDKVGAGSHVVVEIGTEDIRECNSANLIFNFGWRACLIEADPVWAEKGRDYLASMRVGDRVNLINARAMPADINQRLQEAGISGGVDVLSIDIDSHDYWLWRAIDVINPRLVVIEYNACFGPSLSVSVPEPDRAGTNEPDEPWYHGASITAMEKLGLRKGYRLVGGDSRGVNAFFVRRDLADGAGLQPVPAEQAFRPHYRRSRKRSQEQQQERVTRFPLVRID
jgi:hypothetical protein